jgi:alcohol dehydrogenase class IV
MYQNAYTGSSVFQFAANINLRFGRGAIAELPGELAALKPKHVFIVTDPGVAKAGLLDALTQGLAQRGIAFELYSDVEPNPRDITIHRGADRARAAGSDVFVGFGGGSAMDAAKGMALLSTNGGEIGQYDGINKVGKDLPFLVAVPTTAGTGSEVTANAALTNSRTHVKMSLRSPRLLPKLAVVDPGLLRSLPRATAATAGLDALSHAIEGYLSVRASPLSDFFALESIRLIGANLRPFVANPENADAASGMALGALLAGLVISNTGTGNDHAIARALGGTFDTPHGLATGVLLPYVMRFNAPARPERYRAIAQALGLSCAGTDGEVAERACAEVHRMLHDTGVPDRLSQIGVDPSRMAELVDVAIKNVGPNPRRTLPEDLRRLIESAL